MELRKEAKYPTKKIKELCKSNFAPPTCSCVAVQKGHMIELWRKTVNTAEVVDPLIYRKD